MYKPAITTGRDTLAGRGPADALTSCLKGSGSAATRQPTTDSAGSTSTGTECITIGHLEPEPGHPAGNGDGGREPVRTTTDLGGCWSIWAAIIGSFLMGIMNHAYLCVASFLAFQLLCAWNIWPSTRQEMREGPFCVACWNGLLLGRKDPRWVAAKQWLRRCRDRGEKHPLLHPSKKDVATPCAVPKKSHGTARIVKDDMNDSDQGAPVLQAAEERGAWNAAGRLTAPQNSRVMISRGANSIRVDIAPAGVLCAALLSVGLVLMEVFAAWLTIGCVVLTTGIALKVLYLATSSLVLWGMNAVLVYLIAASLVLWDRLEISLEGGHVAHQRDENAWRTLTARVVQFKDYQPANGGEFEHSDVRISSGCHQWGKSIKFGHYIVEDDKWWVAQEVNAWLAEARNKARAQTQEVILGRSRTL